MDRTIYAHCLNDPYNRNQKEFKITFPKTCPICGTAANENHIHAAYCKSNTSTPNLFVTFFCTACENCYIGYYSTFFTPCSLYNLAPSSEIEERVFGTNIQTLSPRFCDIYNQAYACKQNKLDEVSGIGYRKSLEFLIKDYAIHLNPDESEKIKNLPLSKCISEYIDNKRIKRLATASAWIGNDETHYVRKNEDYNIDNLISFIEATVLFIDSDLESIKAENLLNSKNV